MAPNKEDTVVPSGELNCKASAYIITVTKKYVKNELKCSAMRHRLIGIAYQSDKYGVKEPNDSPEGFQKRPPSQHCNNILT
jgi:hypothetical protein